MTQVLTWEISHDFKSKYGNKAKLTMLRSWWKTMRRKSKNVLFQDILFKTEMQKKLLLPPNYKLVKTRNNPLLYSLRTVVWTLISI